MEAIKTNLLFDQEVQNAYNSLYLHTSNFFNIGSFYGKILLRGSRVQNKKLWLHTDSCRFYLQFIFSVCNIEIA